MPKTRGIKVKKNVRSRFSTEGGLHKADLQAHVKRGTKEEYRRRGEVNGSSQALASTTSTGLAVPSRSRYK